MLVLSHRGYWLNAAEKNTTAAFERSFQLGFGTETDLRDLGGALVVSHDPPADGALSIDALLATYFAHDNRLPLAINVKSDGLQSMLCQVLENRGPANYFVFDMAVPDALGWLRRGVPAFTRQSELESQPAFYSQAAGVWLDSFFGEWWDAATVRGHLNAGKNVCIVSPELHGREPRAAWEKLATFDFRNDPRVMICTDYPEAACEVLHG